MEDNLLHFSPGGKEPKMDSACNVKIASLETEIKLMEKILDKYDRRIEGLIEISYNTTKQLEHVTTKFDSFLSDFNNRMKNMIVTIFFSNIAIIVTTVSILKSLLK